MKHIRLVTRLLLFLVVLCNVGHAAETETLHLYVSPQGADTNPGTPGAPLRTIAHAASLASPGTTIHVAPGNYAGGIVTSTHGTVAQPVRFVAELKWTARIIPAPEDSVDFGWRNEGNHVEINGFDIDGVTGDIWRLGIYATGTGNLIRNNHVHRIGILTPCQEAGGAGIVASNPSRPTQVEVTGNIVQAIGNPGCRYVHGIYGTGSGRITNNVVYQVGFAGIHLWHGATSFLIANNTVVATTIGILLGGGDYYQTKVPLTNVMVANNVVVDNQYGIVETGDIGENNGYFHNLLYGNVQSDLDLLSAHSGTLHVDPRFLQYEPGNVVDLRLKGDSPAIDAGLQLTVTETDVLGQARQQGRQVDIGAHEFLGL